MKPRTIIFLYILVMATIAYAADGWQTTYSHLSSLAAGDVLVVIDVSDTTDGSDGTTKHILWGDISFNQTFTSSTSNSYFSWSGTNLTITHGLNTTDALHVVFEDQNGEQYSPYKLDFTGADTCVAYFAVAPTGTHKVGVKR